MAYKGKPANIAKHQAMAKAMTANKKLGTPHGNPLLQDNSGDYNPSPDGIQNGAPDNGPMPFPALGMGIGDGKANQEIVNAIHVAYLIERISCNSAGGCGCSV